MVYKRRICSRWELPADWASPDKRRRSAAVQGAAALHVDKAKGCDPKWDVRRAR